MGLMDVSNSFGYHAIASVIGGQEKHSLLENIFQNTTTLDKVKATGLFVLSQVTTSQLFSSEIKWGSAVLGSVLALGVIAGEKWYSQQRICRSAGLIISKDEFEGVNSSSAVRCDAFPTEHGADSELWRERLIRAAKYNIVFSGNHCGGMAFIRMLNLIEQRMKEIPKLKVVIISSPLFITNQEQIQRLSDEYPAQFSFICSPDIIHISPGVKFSTNHTKGLVIDYGTHFMLGDSGVMDKFVGTGLREFPKHKFLEQRLLKGSEIESEVQREEAVKRTEANTYSKTGRFFGSLIGDFRSMDFVFKSNGKNKAGKYVYAQMLLLCRRWEAYNDATGGNATSDATIGIESIVKQLYRERNAIRQIDPTHLREFDESAQKCQNVAFRLFASGPEQTHSVFGKELIKCINAAKKEIIINHMYLHLPADVMQALIEAVHRGVKIIIITGGRTKDCPKTNHIFGPRNKYNYAYLIKSLPDNLKSKVEVYEFDQSNVGLHKKVIKIDDTVIGGSSNLGYKSLESTSDHELNFIVKSKKFAKETRRICEIDIKHSRRVSNPTVVSIYEYVHSALHRLFAWNIG